MSQNLSSAAVVIGALRVKSPFLISFQEIFPVETFKKAATLGFGAIYCGEEYGGTGLCRMDASIIFEALSQGCTSTTAYLSIHKLVHVILFLTIHGNAYRAA